MNRLMNRLRQIGLLRSGGSRLRLALGVMASLAALTVIALSGPGKAAVNQLLAAVSQRDDQQPRSIATPTTPEWAEQARTRHGWTAGVNNTVLQGSISFYNRDGSSAGTGSLVIYRRYPDLLRVEMTRGGNVQVFGFNGNQAWSGTNTNLPPALARDIRQWLRLSPERLFTGRVTGRSYREAGGRREDFRPGSPWQGQQQINPPRQLLLAEVEDLLGAPPDANQAGDRRLITYYLNAQNYTIETARWLEPVDANRRIEEGDAAFVDLRVEYSNWQTVGGMLLPYEVVVWKGGRVDSRLQISLLLVNQNLPISLFQQQ